LLYNTENKTTPEGLSTLPRDYSGLPLNPRPGAPQLGLPVPGHGSVGEEVLKLRERAPKFPSSEGFVVIVRGGSIDVTAKARAHRFDRGRGVEQRHKDGSPGNLRDPTDVHVKSRN
jgi:hypothetical protein